MIPTSTPVPLAQITFSHGVITALIVGLAVLGILIVVSTLRRNR